MKKLIGFALILLILLVLLAACGRPADQSNSTEQEGEQETYTIRIAYLVPEEHSAHIQSLKFKEKLEEESDGRLTVELYPNGQLYGSVREAIESVQLG